jgi:hypothetical protein
VKADDFLVMTHGSSEEVAHAKAILATANASRVDVYTGTRIAEPADHAADAGA